MPRVPAPKLAASVAAASIARGGTAKGAAKAAPPPRTILVSADHPPTKHHEEDKVCPLCVEELDETDMSFQPCPCGYRVCLFCFEKLKLHCSSACPNCRRGYGSDEAMEYAKQLEVERQQEAMRPKPPPAPASSAAPAASAASRAMPKPMASHAPRRDAPPLPAAKRGSGVLEDGPGHGPTAGLPSGVTWASASPNSLSRNQSVEIERPSLAMDESSWPTLGAPNQQQTHAHARTHHAHHAPSHHHERSQHAPTASGTSGTANGGPTTSHTQHQHRHSPSGASEGVNSYDMSGAGTRRSSSVASSMDRVASSSSLELMSQDPPVTPEQLAQLQHQHQQYQAQHPPPSGLSSGSFPPMPPPGFEASSSYFGAQVATTVNGLRRAVNVPLSLGSSNVEPYPEAPALLASMQQGVAQGTVSSKEAASQLFTLLRQKDQEGQARSRLTAATKPPPGFGAPAASATPAAPAAPPAAPAPAARPPPPPPGFSHLQGTVVPAPAINRAPIQPPAQQANDTGFGSTAGPIGLNANGTPRTYSMWSGLPGMDLAASTGLSSLWQNLNSSALIGAQLGGTTQPYNPLGLGDQSGFGARQPLAAPKAPPPGFGGPAYGTAGQGAGSQLGSGDAVLGSSFRATNPYQPVGSTRYNPLSQQPVMPAAYRPPQLGAGL